MTDADLDHLVDRIRQRDVDALAEFINVRRPQLLKYVQRQLSDAMKRKIEPDDLLQDVATDALRSFDTVDLSEWDPFSWLCQIAQRRIVDAHRRYFGAQKRDASREVSIHSPGGGSPDSSQAGLVNLLVASMTTASQALSRNQREMRLHQAFAELSEDQQKALRLRYVEGLPSKEIAQELGKSDGAVRVMLTRSLNKLQELLEE